MKKIHLCVAIMLIGLVSCQENLNEIITITDPDNTSLNSGYERLKFTDRSDILAAIEEENYDVETMTRSGSFVSMLSKCPTTRNAETGEEMTYYETKGFEQLVPNENFARLLNPNGEVIVNDTIFYINPNGTYYFHKSLESQFKEVLGMDSLGTKISDNLYALADGIFRYETFKETEYEEIELEFEDGAYNIWEEEDDDAISTRAVQEPNYNLFPTFKAGRKTFFGEMRQKLFGHDKYHDVKLSKKRRVRGRVYAYYYVVYSESGITGKMQKKNWIGWSDTQADELRVGWSKMIFRCDVNIPEIGKLPKNEIKVGSVHDFEMPSIKKGKMVDLYLADVDSYDLWKVATEGTKKAVSALNKKYGSGNKIAEKDVHVALITTPKTMYMAINEAAIKEFNVKRINRTFSSNFGFYITLNLKDASTVAVNWLKSAKASVDRENFKLEETDAIFCGRLGNDWVGLKIVQIKKK